MEKQWNTPPAMQIDSKKKYTVSMNTSKGIMKNKKGLTRSLRAIAKQSLKLRLLRRFTPRNDISIVKDNGKRKKSLPGV